MKGFTLLEVMIYIALFSLILSAAALAGYQLFDSGERNQSAVSIQEEGTFLNRKINWALTGASVVAVSGGGSTLTITRPDFILQSPFILNGTGNTITMQRTGSSPAVLNSAAFPVTNVIFTVVPASGGRPASVKTSFLIKNVPFTFWKYLRQ